MCQPLIFTVNLLNFSDQHLNQRLDLNALSLDTVTGWCFKQLNSIKRSECLKNISWITNHLVDVTQRCVNLKLIPCCNAP